MASIEEKVLSLRVDLSRFSGGIKSATSMVDGLKKALAMPGASKGLENVDQAAKSVRFDSLADGVSQVTAQFPVLEAAAAVALGNIASKAASTATSFLKSFTLDPIIGGFKEYEAQLNSVQTVLANTASKGESVETVNAALDTLNTYSDQTIYSFGEMTKNIGTFTAAGVGLNDSVTAIKGFSNLAAASGATTQQMATGMYQLSQALSTGTLKLMDWNSLVNAGVGGEQFQEALKRTAAVHGKSVDDIIAKEGSFRDSLSHGWATAEIVLETLQQMTGDLSDEQLAQMGYTEEQIAQIQQFAKMALDAATKYKTFSAVVDGANEAMGSGWAQTWRILFGDFEQAKALWTPIGDAVIGFIDRMSDARNAVAKAFVDAGGRTAIINTLKNLFDALIRPLSAIGKAFSTVFGGPNGAAIASIAQKIEYLTSTFVMSDENMARLTKTFEGLFGVIKFLLIPIGWAVKILAALALGAAHAASWIASKLVTGLLMLGQWLEPVGRRLVQFVQWLDPIGRVTRLVTTAFDLLSKKASAFGKIISSRVSEPIQRLKTAFATLRATIAEKFAPVIEKVQKIIQKIGDFFAKLSGHARDAGDAASDVGQSFSNFLNDALVDLISWLADRAADVILAFAKALEWLNDVIVGKITPAISGFVDWVKTLVQAFREGFTGAAASFTEGIASKFVTLGQKVREINDKLVSFREKLHGLFAKAGVDVGNVKNQMRAMVSETGYFGQKIAKVRSIWADAFSGKPQKDLTGIKKLISDVASESGRLNKFWTNTKTVFANAFAGNAKMAEFSNGVIGHVQNIAKSLADFGSTDLSIGDKFKSLGSSLGGFFQSLADKMGPKFGQVFAKFSTKLYEVRKALEEFLRGNFVGGIQKMKDAFSGLGETISREFQRIKSGAVTLEEWLSELPSKFSAAWAKIKDVASKLGSVLKDVGSKVAQFIGDNTNSKTAGFVIQGLSIGAIAALVKKLMDLPKAFNNLLPIGDLIDAFRERTKAMQDEVKAKKLAAIAIALLGLAIALKLLAGIPIVNITSAFIALGGSLGILVASMDKIAKIENIKPTKMVAMAIGIIGMAYAMKMIADAMSKLSEMDNQAIVRGTIAVGIIMGGLIIFTNASKTMESKSGSTGFSIKSAIGVIAAAFAVKMVGEAIAQLGSIPQEQVVQGSIVAGAILIGLAVFTNYAFPSVNLGAAFMVLAMVFLLHQMGSILTMFAAMPVDMWLYAVTLMSITMGILVGIMNMASGGLAGAVALMLMSISLLVLAAALTVLSFIPWQALAIGMTILVIGLLALVGVGYLASGAAVGLIVLSIALLAIGIAVLLAAVGFVLFSGALATMAAGLYLVTGALTTFGAAAGNMVGQLLPIMGLGVALGVFAIGLGLLGVAALIAGVGLMLMGVGLMAMSAGFVGIMATAPGGILVLKNAIEELGNLGVWALAKASASAIALAGIGASLIVFGAGALIAGAGAMIMGAGFPLATAALGLFTPVFQRFVAMLPTSASGVQVLMQLGAGMLAFGAGAVVAAASIAAIPLALLSVKMAAMGIQMVMPSMSTAMTTAFATAATATGQFLMVFTTASTQIVAGLLALAVGVAAGSTTIVAAFIQLGTATAAALILFVMAIRNTTASTTSAMAMLASASNSQTSVIGSSLVGMAGKAAVALAMFASAVTNGTGGSVSSLRILGSGVRSSTVMIVSDFMSFSSRSTSILARFVSSLQATVRAVIQLMLQMAAGIRAGGDASVSAMQSAVGRMLGTAHSALSRGGESLYSHSYEIGLNIPRGMAAGINSGASLAINAASNMAARSLAAAKAELDVHSPSREFMKIGRFVDLGMAEGIDKYSSVPEAAVRSMAQALANSATEDLQRAFDESVPVISPVVDLDIATKQLSRLSGLAQPLLDIRPTRDLTAATAYAEKPGREVVYNQTIVNNNFEQNITSPKPVDALTVYRNTKRLVRQMEEVSAT